MIPVLTGDATHGPSLTLVICVKMPKYTVFRKKTPTHVFDYNSGISW